MKKSNFLKIGIGLFLSLLIFSCNDDDASLIVPEQLAKQEVVFDINNFLLQDTSSKGLFSAKENGENDPTLPDCIDKVPSYVDVTIVGPDEVSTTYKLNLVTLNNKTETEVLKLTSGAYTITDFIVKAADDTVLWASPREGSYYELLWDLTGVDLQFIVPEFDKLKVSIDVLCYRPYDYEKFGFAWFKYSVTEIHTVCFYGDVCTKFFEDWHQGSEGNPYLGQTYDGYDFPAIFKVVVKNAQGVVVNDLELNSNASYNGAGSPLCIEYPDQVDIEGEIFTFELWLTMPDGSDKLVYTGEFDDSAMSEVGNSEGFGGSDGVFDFVVGNCSYDGNDANLELPAWIPIPTGMINFTLSNPVAGTGASFYSNVVFNDLNQDSANTGATVGEWTEGFIYDSFCADPNVTISTGPYDGHAFSSLNVSGLDLSYQGLPWGKLNWIVNNMGSYSNADVQDAIWYTIGTNSSIGANNALAIAASSQGSFVPTVGDFAIVILDAEVIGSQDLQLIIVRVDP